MTKLLLLLPLLLIGCSTSSVGVCPQPVHFSRAIETQASYEIQTLPMNSAVVVMLLAYARQNEYLKGINK